MLIFVTTGQNNFPEFKRELIVFSERTYGNLGQLVRTGKHYVPEEVEMPAAAELSNERDPFGIKRELLKDRLKAREREIREMRGKWVAYSADIWSLCSTGSQAAISSDTAWTDYTVESDPLLLWKIVEKTHVGSLTGSTSQDQVVAVKRYYSLMQRPNETTDAFKRRTDDALIALTAAGVTHPDDALKAALYVDALDNSRYAELKSTLNNEEVRNLKTRPGTLLEAHSLAMKTTVVSAKPGAAAGDAAEKVFVSQASQPHRGGRGKGGRGNDGHVGRGGGRSNNNGSGQLKAGAEENPPAVAKANKKSKQQQASSDNSNDCRLCGSSEHWIANCPHISAAKTNLAKEGVLVAKVVTSNRRPFAESAGEVDSSIFCATAVFSEGVLTAVHLSPTAAVFDCGATIHLFSNPQLLTNIRDTDRPITVEGLSGNVVVNQVGDFGSFGEVYFTDKASAVNIISTSCLKNNANVVDIAYSFAENSFKVHMKDGNQFAFERHGPVSSRGGHLYTRDFQYEQQQVLVETVSERELRYTKREIKDALRARAFVRRLAYPSSRAAIDMLSSGAILNCPVTSHDIQRSLDIYGEQVGSLKGKTTASRSVVVKIEHIPLPHVAERELTLYADIMFVNGEPYLLVVALPLGLVLVKDLTARSAPVLIKAFQVMLNDLRSRGFTPRYLLSDREGGVAKVSDQLGLVFNPSGAGQHVPVIERKIRLVKERVRAVCGGLPFKVPTNLLKWVVFYCVSRLNMMPSGTRMDKTSPRELFLGRKLDYKLDLSVSFGDYVQCESVNIIRNSMTPRTEGAIALMPTGNLQGSVKFYCLATDSVITRDHWRDLPMPPIVVAHLNDLAGPSKKGTAGRDPIFARGNSRIEDDNEEDAAAGVPPALIPFAEELPPPNAGVAAEARIPDISSDSMPDFVPPAPPLVTVEQPADLVPDKDDAMESIIEAPEQAEPDTPATIPPVLDVTGVNAAPDDRASAVAAASEEDRRYPKRGNRGNWQDKAKRLSQGLIAAVTVDKDNPHHEYGLHLTVKKAFEKYGVKAAEAIRVELQQMQDLEVWKAVHLGELTKKERREILRSSMFIKEKFDAQGHFDRLRGRFVADGSSQKRQESMILYPTVVSSPTVAQTSVSTGAGIAALEERLVATLDIIAAYLKIMLREGQKIHVRLQAREAAIMCEIEPGYSAFLQPDGTLIVELLKALYGCVESGRLLFEDITKNLIALGFTQNPYDLCVFNKGLPGEDQCSIYVYVDDLMITCRSEAILEETVEAITKVYGSVRVNRGKVHNYLGMTFDFTEKGVCRISMKGYIEELLRFFEVQGTASTPALATLFEINEDSPLLSDELRELFHSAVAKLLFLAKRVRPEYLPVVSFLASRVQAPTEEDMDKLKRAYKNLNGTQDLDLELRFTSPLQLEVHIDASYGVHADGKSHTGGLMTLGGGAIGPMSSKQKLNVKSSTEAELVGVSDYATEGIHELELLRAQGYAMGPARFYQDNMSTLAMIANGSATAPKTRHINIRYFFITNRVEMGDVELCYRPTGEMLADILTKPLQGRLFRKLRAQLLGKKI